MESVQTIPRERISERVVEQIIVTPVPQALEGLTEVANLIPQTRVMQRTVEHIGDAQDYREDDEANKMKIVDMNGLRNYGLTMRNTISEEKVMDKLRTGDNENVLPDASDWLAKNQLAERMEFETTKERLQAVKLMPRLPVIKQSQVPAVAAAQQTVAQQHNLNKPQQPAGQTVQEREREKREERKKAQEEREEGEEGERCGRVDGLGESEKKEQAREVP